MTTLILIRHGYSEANCDGTFTGHRDVDLTEVGYKQAQITADYIISNYKVDGIYSSDLKRAYETAVPLAERLGIDIITTPDLREICAGEFEGRTYDELAKEPEYQIFRKDTGNCVFPKGESMRQVRDRVMPRLYDIVNQNHGKTIAIITHGGPVRVIKTMCEYGDIDRMKDVGLVPNSSVTVIEAENGVYSIKVDGLDKYLGEMHTDFSPKLV